MAQIFTGSWRIDPVTIIKQLQTLFFNLKLLKQMVSRISWFRWQTQVLSNKPTKDYVKASTFASSWIPKRWRLGSWSDNHSWHFRSWEHWWLVTLKVKVSKVLSNADNHVDLWLTVLITTNRPVLWVTLHLTAYQGKKLLGRMDSDRETIQNWMCKLFERTLSYQGNVRVLEISYHFESALKLVNNKKEYSQWQCNIIRSNW